MGITRQQALDCFASDDLIGIGMEADAVRRKLHPDGVVSYIIDRNINYTNFCTEYCTFCAFYRPLKGKLAAEGYILDFDTITYMEIIKLGLRVMDTTAVSLCKDNNLPMIIFSMREMGNIVRVVKGEKLGSLVTA